MDGTRRVTRPVPAVAPEAPVVQLNRVKGALTKVDLAAFQHGQNFKTAPLEEFHLHIGIAFRVAVQEMRKDTFNVLRGGGHFQHAGVTAPEQLRPLADARWRSSIDHGSR